MQSHFNFNFPKEGKRYRESLISEAMLFHESHKVNHAGPEDAEPHLPIMAAARMSPPRTPHVR